MTDWNNETQAEATTGTTKPPDWNVDLSRDQVGANAAAASDGRAIGQARMAANGSILMHLSYAAGPGFFDCDIKYAPANPMYHRILSHLGGLQQGQNKKVAPFDSGAGNSANVIGQASLNSDRSIKVSVNANKSDNYRGEQIIYRASDPYYSIVRQHVGNIEPGETVALKGWTD
jgi:hypothetical protein